MEVNKNIDTDEYFNLDKLILVLEKNKDKDNKTFYTLKIYINTKSLDNMDNDIYVLDELRSFIESVYDDRYTLELDKSHKQHYLKLETEYFESIYDLICDVMYETMHTNTQKYKMISMAIEEVEKAKITKDVLSLDYPSVIDKFISIVNIVYNFGDIDDIFYISNKLL